MSVYEKRGQAFNTKIEFVMLFKTEVLKNFLKLHILLQI